jgi:hypothetical protein
VIASELPAGRVATTIHRGDYSGLEAAHVALRAWCAAREHMLSVGRVEGALLGGLLLAFAEQFIARYAPIPSGYTQGVPLLFLMIFLLVRPTGLLKARA